jgi:acetyltransferase-like isoleucine patch superfamily enzyme
MSVQLRSWLNRARRALARALLFRIVFGERAGDGTPLALTRISPSTCIEHPEQLQLADNVFIGHHNYIEARLGVRIDAGVQITNFVSIVTHSSHRSLRLMGDAYGSVPPEQRPGFIAGPVHIGAYSFIGPHCVIEAGTRIGKGCLVEAHSRVAGCAPAMARPLRGLGRCRGNGAASLTHADRIDRRWRQPAPAEVGAGPRRDT